MLDANKISYISIEQFDTPEEIFKMVMEYSVKANKNPWKCFGEAFNPNYYTIVLMDGSDYVGYGNCHISGNNPTDLFFNHGYLRKGLTNKDMIVNHIAKVVENKVRYVFNRALLTSELDPKLWHMWGFKEDKQIAYEKIL